MIDDTEPTATTAGQGSKEWNAGEYHRLANPHVSWGGPVLDRLPLVGDETVIDAGCGSGRLTAMLLAKLPDGHVIAVDQSANMLDEARRQLEPDFGNRVSFLQANLLELQPPEPVDAIFSTATFHWVLDHDALFRRLFAALKPGGRLVAQCGGGPNLKELLDRFALLTSQPPYDRWFDGWRGPWEFAYPEVTIERLQAAGFQDVAVNLQEAPVVMDDAQTYRDFARTVILRSHLERIPDPRAVELILDELTALAANDDPPFNLDYWRLNLMGQRPDESGEDSAGS